MAKSEHDETITLRVPADVKQRIADIAHAHGISQNAVWKILIAHCVRPALESSLPAQVLPARRPHDEGRSRTESGQSPTPNNDGLSRVFSPSSS